MMLLFWNNLCVSNCDIIYRFL